MRRPLLTAAASALALLLLPTLIPTTQAVVHTPPSGRHFHDAFQFGTAADDRATAVAASEDDVVVVGTTGGALPGQTHGGGDDAYVRVLEPDGTEQWTEQLGGPGDDRATAAAIGSYHIAVGGTTTGDLVGTHHGGTDGWVRAYGIWGNYEDWSVQIGGPGDDAILEVATRNGDVYVAGYRDVAGQRAGFVRKYYRGRLVWEADIDAEAATHVVVPDNDFVDPWVVEESGPPDATTHRVITLSSTTGERSSLTPAWSPGHVMAVTYDAVYLADGGVVTARSHSGDLLWTREVFAGLPDEPVPHEITSMEWGGPADPLVVSVHGDDGSQMLVGYSASGRRRWVERAPGTLDVTSMAYAGMLYVAGSTDASLGGADQGGTDAFVARFARYQPDAYATWSGHYEGYDEYGRGQRLILPVRRATRSFATVGAENEGEVTQRLTIRGCRNHDGYRFTYRRGRTDVTAAVVRGTYRTIRLGRADAEEISVAVKAQHRRADRTRCRIVVASPTTGDSDRISLVIRRR